MAALRQVAVFDLVGRAAHFRKFYTNSSSLSFSLPPRTTVSGIIAAILGRKRDSYYDLLGPGRSLMSVSLRSPVRAVIQTVNNLLVKSPSDLNGSSKLSMHTQVPTEIVLPLHEEDLLVYRVYFAHESAEVFDELADRVRRNAPAYPISLGSAPMLGELRWVAFADEWRVMDSGEWIAAVTPCLVDAVSIVGFDRDGLADGERLQVVKDLMPYSFEPGRRNVWNRAYLYERQGRPLPVRLKTPALRLSYQTGAESGSAVDDVGFAEWGEGSGGGVLLPL